MLSSVLSSAFNPAFSSLLYSFSYFSILIPCNLALFIISSTLTDDKKSIFETLILSFLTALLYADAFLTVPIPPRVRPINAPLKKSLPYSIPVSTNALATAFPSEIPCSLYWLTDWIKSDLSCEINKSAAVLIISEATSSEPSKNICFESSFIMLLVVVLEIFLLNKSNSISRPYCSVITSAAPAIVPSAKLWPSLSPFSFDVTTVSAYALSAKTALDTYLKDFFALSISEA